MSVFFPLTLLSMIFFRSSHVTAKCMIVIFFVYMYHSFFIHSYVLGHLDYFSIFTIVISAEMDIGVHVSFLKFYLGSWHQLYSLCIMIIDISSTHNTSIQYHIHHQRACFPSPVPKLLPDTLSPM